MHSARLFTLFLIGIALAALPLLGDDSSTTTPTSPNLINVKGQTSFHELATFSTERGGTIAYVPKEGTRITTGDVVIQLRDDVPKAILKLATDRATHEGEILEAQKTAEGAWAEYNARMNANLEAEKGGLTTLPEPQTTLDRLKLSAEAAEARVKRGQEQKRDAELQRDQAQAELQTYQVTSHFGGIVTQLQHYRGEGVQMGEPIVKIVNTDSVRVTGNISVVDAYRCHVGMPAIVSVTIPQPDGTLRTIKSEGTLGFIDVEVAAFEYVRIWAEVPNVDNLLREKMKVDLQLIVPESPAPAIPASTKTKVRPGAKPE